MPCRYLCYVFVVLWVLNSTMTMAQDSYSKEELRNSIDQFVNTGETGSNRCNPFVDPGCNTPLDDVPPGCTDCRRGDLSGMLRLTEEGRIVIIGSIPVGKTEIILHDELTQQYVDQIQLGPQIGW